MTAHSRDIICLTVSLDGSIAATGDAGDQPCIICWDLGTCCPITILSGIHKVAVSKLAFSQSGEFLASIGADPARILLVHRWRTQRRVYSSCSDFASTVLGLAFTKDDYSGLAACGDSEPFICFWTREGCKVVRRRGAFGRRARRQPTLCIAQCEQVMLTGQASGHLYVWDCRNCVQSIKAHRGSLNAIHVNSHSVVTGGKDGRIRLWSHALEPGATFDVSGFGSNPTVRSVCISRDGSKILFGTGGNEIFEVSASDGSDALGGAVTSNHYGGRLVDLTPHPLKAEFVTCGRDGTVRAWDILTRNPIRTTKFDKPISCCA